MNTYVGRSRAMAYEIYMIQSFNELLYAANVESPNPVLVVIVVGAVSPVYNLALGDKKCQFPVPGVDVTRDVTSGQISTDDAAALELEPAVFVAVVMVTSDTGEHLVIWTHVGELLVEFVHINWN